MLLLSLLAAALVAVGVIMVMAVAVVDLIGGTIFR
jgi:hypothetical protein